MPWLHHKIPAYFKCSNESAFETSLQIWKITKRGAKTPFWIKRQIEKRWHKWDQKKQRQRLTKTRWKSIFLSTKFKNRVSEENHLELGTNGFCQPQSSKIKIYPFKHKPVSFRRTSRLWKTMHGFPWRRLLWGRRRSWRRKQINHPKR